MEYVAKERMGGLYNAVPHNSISKYELLKLFNKYLRDNSVTINPVEGIVEMCIRDSLPMLHLEALFM